MPRRLTSESIFSEGGLVKISKLHAFSLAVGVLSISYLMAQSVPITPSNTPGFIRNAIDRGPVDPAAIITVNVWLKLHNEQRLDRLAMEQKQKNSPNYHRWITEDQFDADYGPTRQEVDAVSHFLSAQDLTVLSVAENNLYVKAQGSVAAIQKAFHVEIHNFQWNGATYRSNTADPSMAGSERGLIAAVTGLDDFGFQPQAVRPATPDGVIARPTPLLSSPEGFFFEAHCFRPVETDTFSDASNHATYTGNRFGSDITS